MATKTVWKFGNNWVGMKNGKKKFFKTRKQASAYAGKKKRSPKKTKSKPKQKRRTRAKTAITRRGRSVSRRYKKYSRRRKAISIAILPMIFMLWVLATAFRGVSLDQLSLDNLAQPFENIKGNWKGLVTGAVIVSLLGMTLRRFRIGIGIPGAIRARLA
jgi:hypothetical protein